MKEYNFLYMQATEKKSRELNISPENIHQENTHSRKTTTR
jgi:hypothetical protein